jgi:hypothetical protein
LSALEIQEKAKWPALFDYLFIGCGGPTRLNPFMLGKPAKHKSQNSLKVECLFTPQVVPGLYRQSFIRAVMCHVQWRTDMEGISLGCILTFHCWTPEMVRIWQNLCWYHNWSKYTFFRYWWRRVVTFWKHSDSYLEIFTINLKQLIHKLYLFNCIVAWEINTIILSTCLHT